VSVRHVDFDVPSSGGREYPELRSERWDPDIARLVHSGAVVDQDMAFVLDVIPWTMTWFHCCYLDVLEASETSP
jgi:hypothetical protein